MTQPQEVLPVPREVEAVGGVEELDGRWVTINAGAHDRYGRVTGDRPQQRERDHRDDEQHHDRLEDPADQEGYQRWPLSGPRLWRRGDRRHRRDLAPDHKGSCARHYFTKYQYSGVMLSVGLCGTTPLRLLAISVSEYTPFGCHMTGSCALR